MTMGITLYHRRLVAQFTGWTSAEHMLQNRPTLRPEFGWASVLRRLCIATNGPDGCFPSQTKEEKGFIDVKVGQIFFEYINQKIRQCEIIKVTKTRFQFEYELPKTGTTCSWRHHENREYLPTKT